MKSDVRVAWLITFAIGGWLIYLLAPVLTPFIAAALLAYIGDPLADRLQKLKLPRTLAVVCVFLLTFVLIGVLVLLVGPLVRQQVGALFSALPSIASQVEQVWLPNAAEFLGVEPGEDFGLSAFLAQYSDMAGTWAGKALSSVTSTGSMLAAAVMSLFLIPILTFYLLRDWDKIIHHVAALVPDSNKITVFSLARETDEVLGAFLRGQLLVMFALALIYSVGLGIVGLEFAIAIGVVSGLVSFVPYLESALAYCWRCRDLYDRADDRRYYSHSEACRGSYRVTPGTGDFCDCRRWPVIRILRHPACPAGCCRTLSAGTFCLQPVSQGTPGSPRRA